MTTQVLFLSSSGDCFKAQAYDHTGFREIDFANDQVHPSVKAALACKTHEAVLNFLTQHKDDVSFRSAVVLYHVNNFFHSGHASREGAAHKESIHEMQAFVQSQIRFVKVFRIALSVMLFIGACSLLIAASLPGGGSSLNTSLFACAGMAGVGSFICILPFLPFKKLVTANSELGLDWQGV